MLLQYPTTTTTTAIATTTTTTTTKAMGKYFKIFFEKSFKILKRVFWSSGL